MLKTGNNSSRIITGKYISLVGRGGMCLLDVLGTPRIFSQANDSPGRTGGDRQYSYPVMLLMRSCTAKLHNNLSPSICGHLVLLPNDPKTGTRLDAVLCSLFCLIWKLGGL